jgi:hypothetical protein
VVLAGSDRPRQQGIPTSSPAQNEDHMNLRLAAVAGLAAAAIGLTGCASDTSTSANDVAGQLQSAAGQLQSAASSAAGQLQSAASAAAGAASSAAAGACGTLNQVKGELAAQSAANATVGQITEAASASVAKLEQAAQDAGPVTSAVLTALIAAENSLIGSLAGQSSDTPIAQAPLTARNAITGVGTAYDSVYSALNCS